MSYTTQAIICLANDLENSARARQAKREAAGDDDLNLTIGTAPTRTVKKSRLFLNGSAMGSLPVEYRLTNSRLIIHGHGNPQSTHIMGSNGLQWTPKQLAEKIKGWLDGCRIKRISLNMCYSAGNRGGQGATDLDSWTVSAFESFAYQLARHCRYGETISGATDVHETNRRVTSTGELSREGAVVFSTVGGRYKQKGDKVIFTTDPNATPDNPVDPTASLPSSNKPRPW